MTNLLDQTNNDNVDDTLPPVDPNKNYLEELVGEGKKFKTVEDLARGKYEADRTILHKDKQFDLMRNDYLETKQDRDARANLAELIEQLKQQRQQITSSDTTQMRTNPDEREPQEIDLTKVDERVATKLKEIELARKQEENVRQVDNKLREHYGENYKGTLKQQVDKLGLTQDFVNDLAKNYPTVLYRTLGLDQQPPREDFQAPPRNQQVSFAPNVQKRTWSFYEKLRKEQPDVYWDPKTQTQLIKDSNTLGKEFRDSSFSPR